MSMDIGSVRLTERHMASDQPDGEQIRAAVTDIDTHLDEAAEVVDLGAARTFIGVAGTVTTLTAGILGLDSYQRERIHGARLTVSEVERQADDLVRMDRDARAALPYMHPGRVDVIAAGGLIFARTVSRVDDAVRTRGGELAITVSETDILDGIALDLAS